MPADAKLEAAPALAAVSPSQPARLPVTNHQPYWAVASFGMAMFATAVRLFFWFYTQRTWEDALITVQHAENAARGLGLNHAPFGPRVHGFTSALSVLIPLLGEFIHHGFGLPLLKFVSVICGGVAVWLAMRICQRLGLAFPTALLVGGYLAIEHQQILFGMAGMETQIAAAAVLLSLYCLFDLRPAWMGVSLALCALVRPDFGFWVLLYILLVGWRCWRRRNWHPLESIFLSLLLICGPWVAFTTWYYGSPLPNTILAKAWGFGDHWYAGLSMLGVVAKLWSRTKFVFAILGPAYAGNGTGFARFPFDPHGAISYAVLVLAVLGGVVGLRSKVLPAIGIVCFFFVYSAYYLFLVGVIALWYCIPLAAIAVMAAALGLDAIINAIFSAQWRPIIAYSATALYLLSFVVIMPATFRGEQAVQELVENGVRKQVGLYVASVTLPDQTIGCEPLGYIGYYSRRVVYAYPGMCNLDVVRYVRKHPQRRNLIDMLNYFRPDYIALRPMEYRVALGRGNTWLLNDYELVKIFGVSGEDKARLLFPRDNLDAEFYVFKRISPLPAPVSQ